MSSACEIVIEKRPSIVVPQICAGCSAPPTVPTSLGVRGGLSLTVGLCAACSASFRRAERRWQTVLAFSLVTAGAVAFGLFFAPPIGVAPTWLAPPLAGLAVAVALLAKLRPKVVEAAPRLGVPFRSPSAEPQASQRPGLPVQMTKVRGSQALVYCASSHFAAELAAQNGFQARAMTRAPQLPNTTAILACTAVLGTTAAGVLWAYQYPQIAIDNATGAPIVVYWDGEARWEIPPIPDDAPPRLVHVPRGLHSIGYSGGGQEAPETKPVDIGPSGSERFIYNPGRRSCYRRYGVVYAAQADASADSVPGFELLVGETVYIAKTDFFFKEPDKSIKTKQRSETRMVIEKDEACTVLVRAGCSVDQLVQCVRGGSWTTPIESCFTAAFEQCEASTSSFRPD